MDKQEKVPRCIEWVKQMSVYIFEDEKAEIDAVELLGKDFEGVWCVSSNPTGFLVEHSATHLSEVTNGILTDIMFGREAEGLAIVMKAILDKIPCVIVTRRDYADGSGHQPRWVLVATYIAQEFPWIEMIEVRETGVLKPWEQAEQLLRELIYRRLLEGDSCVANSFLRLHNSAI